MHPRLLAPLEQKRIYFRCDVVGTGKTVPDPREHLVDLGIASEGFQLDEQLSIPAVVLLKQIRQLTIELEKRRALGLPTPLGFLPPVQFPLLQDMLGDVLQGIRRVLCRPALMIAQPCPKQVDRVHGFPTRMDTLPPHAMSKHWEVEIVPVPGVHDIDAIHLSGETLKQFTLSLIVLTFVHEKPARLWLGLVRPDDLP